MKKNHSLTGLVVLLALVVLAGCNSVKVERVSPDTVTDLSGYWNDTDVRIVAESLIADCVNAPAITNYIRNNNALPVVIVGNFRNDSDEHIDTSILSKKFEVALINSGKVDFVASSSERGEIRQEREEQQAWASEETAKRLANETGADFMLIGSVKTMVEHVNNVSTRTYWVYAELIDIESNRKLWLGENSEIKKVITKSKTRM
ncbi:MAG: penicillin-binding protein activator LpoB [Treponema sp.]|nr:penicillin-binding protein activator LpoB [Spirochaetia bacterium]MDD7275928.1 penicillin-binding protein activator LpoB [Treponema sp.]MDY3754862.1 penicillin-binding protein activator LpoB [Treponema sp.]MDY4674659.1 penicillin-binding protein activator LpoB [Treponema sp.]